MAQPATAITRQLAAHKPPALTGAASVAMGASPLAAASPPGSPPAAAASPPAAACATAGGQQHNLSSHGTLARRPVHADIAQQPAKSALLALSASASAIGWSAAGAAAAGASSSTWGNGAA